MAHPVLPVSPEPTEDDLGHLGHHSSLHARYNNGVEFRFGTTAAKPLATAVESGTVYWDTTLDTLSRSNGTIWVALSAGATDHGALTGLADDDHPQYETTAEVAAQITTHAGLADPHTGYRLESADHTHATTGLQGGTVAHSALTGLTTGDDHTQYITKAIVDAKGDIIAATAADAVSRLAVGANATVLTADSAMGTGLKWAAPAGGAPDVQVFTANGTWTKPASASVVRVILLGAGGGGGRSVNGAGAGGGGGGGGGGLYREQQYRASELGATESVVAGAFGAGGTTSGASGVAGGASTFKGVTAQGGGGGAAGGVAGQGGRLVTATAASLCFGPSQLTATGLTGQQGENAGGNAGGSGTSAVGGTGGSSMYGGGGGGGGGSADPDAGGAGGAGGNGTYASGDGGVAGTAPGGAGGAGAVRFSGGGGGGGSTTTGGAGGVGSPGGGGGGGGQGTTTSGNGGDGGAGLVVVITWP